MLNVSEMEQIDEFRESASGVSSSKSESSSSDDIKLTPINPPNQEIDQPLRGQIKQEKTQKIRTAEETRSTLTRKTLRGLLKGHTPQSKGVFFEIAEGDDRVHKPPLEATGFYSQALSLGVGVPIHHFFISILNS